MKDKPSDLEKIIMGEIERRDRREVPGLNFLDGTEFLYYQDDGNNKPKRQFNLLLDSAGAIVATRGGVVSDKCCIYLPDGMMFHALSYHGDIMSWRSAVEAGAGVRGLLLARIENGNFVVSDGRSFRLSECKIDFN